jgi:hypothetical protein
MQKVFAQIMTHDGMVEADSDTISVQEIFQLQGLPDVKANKARFLR